MNNIYGLWILGMYCWGCFSFGILIAFVFCKLYRYLAQTRHKEL